MAAARRYPEIFGDGEAREHALDLQRALDAKAADAVRLEAGNVPAAKEHTPLIRRQQPGDEIEQCCLAGAVRPDDRVQARSREAEIQIVDSQKPAKALAQAFSAQDGLAHGSVRSSTAPDGAELGAVSRTIQSSQIPITPRGARITTRIATAPTISAWCSQWVDTTSRTTMKSVVPTSGPSSVPAPPTIAHTTA